MSYVATFPPYFFIGYQRNQAKVGQSFFAPCKDCMELSEADRRLLLQPRVKQPETWGKMRLWWPPSRILKFSQKVECSNSPLASFTQSNIIVFLQNWQTFSYDRTFLIFIHSKAVQCIEDSLSMGQIVWLLFSALQIDPTPLSRMF